MRVTSSGVDPCLRKPTRLSEGSLHEQGRGRMASAAISEGEAAVYDRQLRLWGVEAQQRLLKSKVLIWGVDGCNVEVCKNLVLAGVPLIIRDHRSVSMDDVAFNYFLREEDLSKNRAECATERIREMNPLCEVVWDTKAPEEVGSADALRESLQGTTMVCATLAVLGWDTQAAKSIDSTCRALGSGFMLSLTCGELAFFFTDLHTHVVRERSSAQGSAASPSDAAPKPETIQFPTLSEWLGCSPSQLVSDKVDPSFLLIVLFMAFVSKDRDSAKPGADMQFRDFCESQISGGVTVDGFESLASAFPLFFVEPLVHVASVLGGLMAQEAIKAITQRDPPLVNSVCFNAHTCAALVERIPAARAPAPKRKAEEQDICIDD